MSKALIVNDYWKPLLQNETHGGTEKAVLLFANGLSKIGVDVAISSSKDSDTKVDGYPVLRWNEYSKRYKASNNLGRMNGVRIAESVVNHIEEFKADFVVLKQTSATVMRRVARYCSDKGVPLYYHLHSDVSYWGIQYLNIRDAIAELYNMRGVYTITVSEYLKSKLERDGAPFHYYLYHFYVTNNFSEDKADLIVSAERLEREKGLHHLLNRLPNRLRLRVYGGIPTFPDKEVEYARKLLDTIERLDNAEYLGVVPPSKVLEEMAKAKFVYSGDYDAPCSLVVTEGFSSGCVIIRRRPIQDGAVELARRVYENTGVKPIMISVKDEFRAPELEQLRKIAEATAETFSEENFLQSLKSLYGL